MELKLQPRYKGFYDSSIGQWVETNEIVGYKFSDEDRMAVVREYLEGDEPASKIARKYLLSGPAVLFNWIDKYSRGDQVTTNSVTQQEDKKAQSLAEKDEEIRRLRKALELEKIRSQAYSTMIDIAEAQFNIPIRKKPGTKR